MARLNMRMILFLLIFLLDFIDSIKIGYIMQSSVITNTSSMPTLDSRCLDCLCNCVTNRTSATSRVSKCYGINCFPSNKTCQQIEQQWIQETDLVYDSTSENFVSTISLKFCSCYSTQNILDTLANVTPIYISYQSIRYLKYNIYDNTLLVLGNTSITRYSVENLTNYQRFNVSDLPQTTCVDSMNVYVLFSKSLTIGKYDMNMRLIQSINISRNSTGLYNASDIARWRNQLLVSDISFNLIRSVNLTTSQMFICLNISSFMFYPFDILVFNDLIYIKQISWTTIYIFDLVTASRIREITFSALFTLYSVQKEPFCNRAWYGMYFSGYPSIGVLHLDTNEQFVYQVKNMMVQTYFYSFDFDSNYSMYTIARDSTGFYKYSMPTSFCGN